MEDELTTLMHAEFMEGEISPLQLHCLDAWVRLRKGEPKQQALDANNLTEEEYDANIDAALRAI